MTEFSFLRTYAFTSIYIVLYSSATYSNMQLVKHTNHVLNADVSETVKVPRTNNHGVINHDSLSQMMQKNVFLDHSS